MLIIPLRPLALLLLSGATAGFFALPARADIIDLTIFQEAFGVLPADAGNGGPSLTFAGLPVACSLSANAIHFGFPPSWTPCGLSTFFLADLTGNLDVTSVANYTFSLGSDDGSLLFIDGALVVKNNYFQGLTYQAGAVNLTAGVHPFEVQYFQGGGRSQLDLPLPPNVSFVGTSSVPEPSSWVLVATILLISGRSVRLRTKGSRPK